MMIFVAIADDHRLLLEGLQEALQAIPDLEVIGAVEDGEALIEMLSHSRPDVVLVDIDMPRLDGLTALQRLESAPPAIIVSMHQDDAHRDMARAAGAAAFLSKTTPLPDLAAAVRAVHDGRTLFDVDKLPSILEEYSEPVLEPGAASLTDREREVLALLASGASTTEELATRLYISQKTVKNHLANIYAKLDVVDRAQAVVEAVRLGLHKRPK